jgi:hypothetical protein
VGNRHWGQPSCLYTGRCEEERARILDYNIIARRAAVSLASSQAILTISSTVITISQGPSEGEQAQTSARIYICRRAGTNITLVLSRRTIGNTWALPSACMALSREEQAPS